VQLESNGTSSPANTAAIDTGTEPGGAPVLNATDTLPNWLVHVLAERRLPTGVVKDWASFERRDEQFANAARWFLRSRDIPLPPGVPEPQSQLMVEAATEMAVLGPVLDRYIRHGLRRSSNPDDQERAIRAVNRLRVLGIQVTETGSQACASPVGRVMAYSKSKVAAIVPILRAERAALGERIRAIVVADFEKSSAMSAEISHLLDKEAGGAMAAFRTLLADPDTDALEPVLVTGSSVLVDDDLAPRLMDAATEWLARRGIDVQLQFAEEQGFKVLAGRGSDWCPRVYVTLITELFQAGLIRCLVGTRGLLGEGWDATKVNVLVDLTTVTTSMSVNQLRGRSIRLDPDDPAKLADNWDVVCMAPEFVKGFDDYARFQEKHETLYGLTEDGAVEKGVGHVHPAFTELKPEGVEGTMELLNAEMTDRVRRRFDVRSRWRIGQPYRGDSIRALELRTSPGTSAGFPPFRGSQSPWSQQSLTLAIGRAVLGALQEIGQIKSLPDVHVSDRAGGYVRTFLENASDAESAVFAQALQEVLGPLDRPRYVISRSVWEFKETWLSRVLPVIVGRYFQRRDGRMAMLHAVPSALAKNKDLAAIFQRHWNAYVSPGEALYAHQGEGEQLIRRAERQGVTPQSPARVKEIFY
jgi:hypothetical protein